MDLKYTHGSEILKVRACYNDDATDLIAIAGENSVEVLQWDDKSIKLVASFYLGLRPTALAWSPRALSPAVSDEWIIELAASTHDFGLHILTKSHDEDEDIFHFGGGLTGHHGRINDITFLGGRVRDLKHLATVSDDKNLIVWDLYPSSDILPSTSSSSSNTPRSTHSADPTTRHQPTALVIPFAHSLTSVASHPSTSKDLVVCDSRGSVYLTDWRKDPGDEAEDAWHRQSVFELVHPSALAKSVSNLSGQKFGSVSWRLDDSNMIGAAYGSGYALWNLASLRGGKPFATGPSFPDGIVQFRWCPTYPEYFALSSNSPQKGAAIHFCNTGYLQTQPTVLQIAPRPHRVLDFDWLASSGIPRVAAAVGRVVLLFSIGMD